MAWSPLSGSVLPRRGYPPHLCLHERHASRAVRSQHATNCRDTMKSSKQMAWTWLFTLARLAILRLFLSPPRPHPLPRPPVPFRMSVASMSAKPSTGSCFPSSQSRSVRSSQCAPDLAMLAHAPSKFPRITSGGSGRQARPDVNDGHAPRPACLRAPARGPGARSPEALRPARGLQRRARDRSVARRGLAGDR